MASKKSDKTDTETLGYAEAANELEAILEEIEKGDADVDVLSTRVERAALLIRLCREKLAGTELAVKRVVDQLAKDEPKGGEEE